VFFIMNAPMVKSLHRVTGLSKGRFRVCAFLSLLWAVLVIGYISYEWYSAFKVVDPCKGGTARFLALNSGSHSQLWNMGFCSAHFWSWTQGDGAYLEISPIWDRQLASVLIPLAMLWGIAAGVSWVRRGFEPAS
jgi:hypothetical protein